MPQYIDKDEVLKKVSWDTEAYYSINMIPTADVVERKVGKWVKENIVLTSNPPQYMWHCSVCGKPIHGYSDSILTNFCPNCGAEMKGEDDGLN